MTAWLVPLILWIAVTVGARGLLERAGCVRCRAGDWGTAFLAGFTLFTFLVYAASLLGIRIGGALFCGVALLVLAGGILARRGAPSAPKAKEAPWTPAEALLALAFLVYAGAVALNALFFPEMSLDAHSYDGRARFLLHDGTLDLALYHWPGASVQGSTNITYPPLFSLGLAVGHAFGGWQSKIVNPFFSVAWPLVVYGALRQSIPRFWALAWTLFLAVTPDVLAHASYALLNMPAMALTTGEAVALARFVRYRERRWLFLAALFAAGAAGVRPDAVSVHAALLLTASVALLLDRRPREILFLGAPALAPLLTWGTWTLYLKLVIGAETLAPAGGEERIGLGKVLHAVRVYLLSWETYGATFLAWFPSLLLFWARRNRDGLFFLGASVAVLASLVTVFSTLDASYGGGPSEVLSYSFKRSLFYVVPLAGLAAALNPPGIWLAARGRGWIHHGTSTS